MQSSCPESSYPPACSPTHSLLNLTRPPGRRRPAAPEAFAVLTNACLVSYDSVDSISDTSRSSPPPSRASARSQRRATPRHGTARRTRPHTSIRIRLWWRPAPMVRSVSSPHAPARPPLPCGARLHPAGHCPNPVNQRALDNDAPPRRFAPSPLQRHACNPSASRCQHSSLRPRTALRMATITRMKTRRGWRTPPSLRINCTTPPLLLNGSAHAGAAFTLRWRRFHPCLGVGAGAGGRRQDWAGTGSGNNAYALSSSPPCPPLFSVLCFHAVAWSPLPSVLSSHLQQPNCPNNQTCTVHTTLMTTLFLSFDPTRLESSLSLSFFLFPFSFFLFPFSFFLFPFFTCFLDPRTYIFSH
ncbi:hypothetical protein K438DRAFT_375865 [Mycena galopus ATCC 62051]|nr:hypothetical protein K438DRAFT_375865 [Mycena galopus ATCC 62051]